MMKTRRKRCPALESWLIDHHPYEVTELLALPVDRGVPDYLEWVVGEITEQAAE